MFAEFFLSRAASSVFSLATFVVVAHGVDVSTAGIYISAASYAVLLYSFLDLGTGPNLVREAVEGDYRVHVAGYVWTRAFITLLVIAVGAIGVLILFPADARSAGFISLIFVAASMNGIPQPIGQVIGDVTAFRVLTLVQGLLVFLAVLAVVLLVRSPSAELLIAAYSLGAAVAALASVIWAQKHMKSVPFRSLPAVVKDQVRAVFVLAVATGAGSLYMRIDQALVLRLRDASQAAFYGLASRIAFQARLIPSAVQLSISPLLAERLRTQGRLNPEERRSISVIAMSAGLGLALLVIFTSDLAVLLLGGKKYDDAVLPTIIMGVSLVATCYNYVVATSAVMAGRDRQYLPVMLGTLALNVVANLLLIPHYGIQAAAATTLLTEVVSVTILAQIVGLDGGATRNWIFAAVLGSAAVGAVIKWGLLDAPLGANIAVSALFSMVGAACLKRAFDELRVLPSPRVVAEVEVAEAASDIS
jgi:O-antigen/teichoic acid export membrane protein